MDNEIIRAAYNDPFGLRDVEGITLIVSIVVVTIWGIRKFWRLRSEKK